VKRVLLFAFVLLSILAGGLLLLHARGNSPEVPTIVIHRQSFRTHVSAEGNLEAVKSTPLSAPTVAGMRQKIAWMLPDGSWVEQGAVVVRFDSTDFERMREKGQDELAVLHAQLRQSEIKSKAKLENLERERLLSGQEAEIARNFKNADTNLYSRNDIIESEIDTKLAEGKAEHARQAGEIQEDLSKTEEELLEIEVKKKKLVIKQAEEGLESLQLLAPHEGFVIFKRDWRGNTPRVGEIVYPGQPLASIPLLDSMQAAVYVLEADAGGLESGEKAEVFLDAHPRHSFQAEVTSVDPIAQRRIRWVPVQYFRAVLGLKKTDPQLMKPGQRVHADICVGEESAAIAIPRQAVSSHDGKHRVFRLENDGFHPVDVELGASVSGRIIIEKGLKEGDVIALRDPTSGLEKQQESTGPAPLGGVS